MLLKDTKLQKAHVLRQFACQYRVCSWKVNGQRGFLCWQLNWHNVLLNVPRHSVSRGKTANRYKGEDFRQALIFNAKLLIKDCLNSYQNLKYAFFLFIIWEFLPFQMVSWIFYTGVQTVDVQSTTFSSNDLWPINLSKSSC